MAPTSEDHPSLVDGLVTCTAAPISFAPATVVIIGAEAGRIFGRLHESRDPSFLPLAAKSHHSRQLRTKLEPGWPPVA